MATDFLEFLPSLPLSNIQVFSNKSKSESTDKATNYKSITYQYGLQITRKTGSFGLNTKVFDTKAADTLKKTHSTLTSPRTKLATNI